MKINDLSNWDGIPEPFLVDLSQGSEGIPGRVTFKKIQGGCHHLENHKQMIEVFKTSTTIPIKMVFLTITPTNKNSIFFGWHYKSFKQII